ncbi:MAG: hypothetical protein AVDCRST_MAG12-298, partial [uncultured Rubrobacteraceae bacterium]
AGPHSGGLRARGSRVRRGRRAREAPPTGRRAGGGARAAVRHARRRLLRGAARPQPGPARHRRLPQRRAPRG